MDFTVLEARILELDYSDTSLSGSQIFDIIVDEFRIEDAETIISCLGCRCPYGLLGYLEADYDFDGEK